MTTIISRAQKRSWLVILSDATISHTGRINHGLCRSESMQRWLLINWDIIS